MAREPLRIADCTVVLGLQQTLLSYFALPMTPIPCSILPTEIGSEVSVQMPEYPGMRSA